MQFEVKGQQMQAIAKEELEREGQLCLSTEGLLIF